MAQFSWLLLVPVVAVFNKSVYWSQIIQFCCPIDTVIYRCPHSIRLPPIFNFYSLHYVVYVVCSVLSAHCALVYSMLHNVLFQNVSVEEDVVYHSLHAWLLLIVSSAVITRHIGISIYMFCRKFGMWFVCKQTVRKNLLVNMLTVDVILFLLFSDCTMPINILLWFFACLYLSCILV